MAVKGKIEAGHPRRLRAAAGARRAKRIRRGARRDRFASPRCGSRTSCRERRRPHRSRPNLELSRRPAAGGRARRLADRRRRRPHRERAKSPRSGRRSAILASAPPGAAIDDHSRQARHARLHRPAYPLPPDPRHRLLRRAALGLAAKIHLRRRAEIRRSELLRDGRALLPRRIVPPGHDDGVRLLHHPPRIGRRVLRRKRAARRAHDRRQGDDGPQRARRADGYVRSAATTKARR